MHLYASCSTRLSFPGYSSQLFVWPSSPLQLHQQTALFRILLSTCTLLPCFRHAVQLSEKHKLSDSRLFLAFNQTLKQNTATIQVLLPAVSFTLILLFMRTSFSCYYANRLNRYSTFTTRCLTDYEFFCTYFRFACFNDWQVIDWYILLLF